MKIVRTKLKRKREHERRRQTLRVDMCKGWGPSYLVSHPRQPGTVIRFGRHPIMINAEMMNGNANVCEVASAIKGGISLTLSSCQIYHCQWRLHPSTSSQLLKRGSSAVKKNAMVKVTTTKQKGNKGSPRFIYGLIFCVTDLY